VWHVSLARFSKTAIIPLDRWGGGVRREARRLVDSVLSGAGTGPLVEHVSKSGTVVHFRRSLSDEEIATLSPAWLAIPAQDEFSEDGLVEMRL
jgi:hypothetical protein